MSGVGATVLGGRNRNGQGSGEGEWLGWANG